MYSDELEFGNASKSLRTTERMVFGWLKIIHLWKLDTFLFMIYLNLNLCVEYNFTISNVLGVCTF